MAGVYIKGLKVTPETAMPTAIESVQESDTRSQKLIEDGRFIILREGVKYNAQGAVLK
jgi:hypothetical protein